MIFYFLFLLHLLVDILLRKRFSFLFVINVNSWILILFSEFQSIYCVFILLLKFSHIWLAGAPSSCLLCPSDIASSLIYFLLSGGNRDFPGLSWPNSGISHFSGSPSSFKWGLEFRNQDLDDKLILECSVCHLACRVCSPHLFLAFCSEWREPQRAKYVNSVAFSGSSLGRPFYSIYNVLMFC